MKPNFAQELLELEKTQEKRVEKAGAQAAKDIKEAMEKSKSQVEKAELNARKRIKEALAKATEIARESSLKETQAFKVKEKKLKQKSQKKVNTAIDKCLSVMLK